MAQKGEATYSSQEVTHRAAGLPLEHFPFLDGGWARTGFRAHQVQTPTSSGLISVSAALSLLLVAVSLGLSWGGGGSLLVKSNHQDSPPSHFLILGIPALWKEPCGLKEFPSWAPASLLLYCQNPAPPIPLFVPTLGLSLPVDSLLPLSAGHRSLRPGSGGLGGQLGMPLGTENFLLLLGSGSQMPGLGLATILSLGSLVGRRKGTSGSGSKMDSILSFPESLGEGVAGWQFSDELTEPQ